MCAAVTSWATGTNDYLKCTRINKIYHAAVTYSATSIGGEPSSVVDCTFPGAEIPDNNPGLNLLWYTGWVRTTMSQAQCLTHFVLTPAMSPPGNYTLKISLEDDDQQEMFAETFTLYWPDATPYKFSMPKKFCGVHSVKFETISNPSWVGWYEMRAY